MRLSSHLIFVAWPFLRGPGSGENPQKRGEIREKNAKRKERKGDRDTRSEEQIEMGGDRERERERESRSHFGSRPPWLKCWRSALGLASKGWLKAPLFLGCLPPAMVWDQARAKLMNKLQGMMGEGRGSKSAGGTADQNSKVDQARVWYWWKEHSGHCGWVTGLDGSPRSTSRQSSKSSSPPTSRTTTTEMHGGPVSSGGSWVWPSVVQWKCRLGRWTPTSTARDGRRSQLAWLQCEGGVGGTLCPLRAWGIDGHFQHHPHGGDGIVPNAAFELWPAPPYLETESSTLWRHGVSTPSSSKSGQCIGGPPRARFQHRGRRRGI